MFTEYEEFLKSVEEDKSPQTLRSYKNAIDMFVKYCEIQSLDDIRNLSSKKIKEYRSALLDQDIAISSVNAYMRPLKAFFTWMMENGDEDGNNYLSANPLDTIKPLKQPKKSYPRLTSEEMESMIAACGNLRDKLILALMASTGVRRGEIVKIKVEDIGDTHIKIHRKGNWEDLVPIHDSIRPLLEEYLSNHEGEYLFSSPRDKEQALSAESVRLVVMNAAKRSNIDAKKVERITPHTFRRSLGTEVVNSGEGVDKAQKILRHKNISTTMIYAEVAQSTADKILLNRKIEIR